MLATRFYALVSTQGTAASETGICEYCFDEDAKGYILASASGDIDIEAGFVDVTGNDAIHCTVCDAVQDGVRLVQGEKETTLATNRYRVGQDLWRENSIQFPRLLAEIDAVSPLTPQQEQDVADSMDLSVEAVRSLFERASRSWERIKERTDT